MTDMRKHLTLFMRVLGIEEMVVKGQVYSWPDGYVNHEWNMVFTSTGTGIMLTVRLTIR